MPLIHDVPLLLTINPAGEVLPSPELLQALGIRHGAAVELRPPRQRNGGSWHLDTRPEARRRLTHTANTRPRFNCDYVLSPRHFRSGPGQLYTRLALLYDPAQSTITPGYYELRPSFAHSTPAYVPEPTAPQTPPLAACPAEEALPTASGPHVGL